MNATENSVAYAQLYLDWFMVNDLSRWEVQNDSHIKFYFQDKSSVTNYEDFLLYHEQAFINIEEFFNFSMDQRIFFFVWDNTYDPLAILGKSYPFALPRLYIVNTSYYHTYGHEIAHVIMYHALKTKISHMLLNEGIAVYLDQSNRNRIETERIALNGKILNLSEL